MSRPITQIPNEVRFNGPRNSVPSIAGPSGARLTSPVTATGIKSENYGPAPSVEDSSSVHSLARNYSPTASSLRDKSSGKQPEVQEDHKEDGLEEDEKNVAYIRGYEAALKDITENKDIQKHTCTFRLPQYRVQKYCEICGAFNWMVLERVLSAELSRLRSNFVEKYEIDEASTMRTFQARANAAASDASWKQQRTTKRTMQEQTSSEEYLGKNDVFWQYGRDLEKVQEAILEQDKAEEMIYKTIDIIQATLKANEGLPGTQERSNNVEEKCILCPSDDEDTQKICREYKRAQSETFQKLPGKSADSLGEIKYQQNKGHSPPLFSAIANKGAETYPVAEAGRQSLQAAGEAKKVADPKEEQKQVSNDLGSINGRITAAELEMISDPNFRKSCSDALAKCDTEGREQQDKLATAISEQTELARREIKDPALQLYFDYHENLRSQGIPEKKGESWRQERDAAWSLKDKYLSQVERILNSAALSQGYANAILYHSKAGGVESSAERREYFNKYQWSRLEAINEADMLLREMGFGELRGFSGLWFALQLLNAGRMLKPEYLPRYVRFSGRVN